MTRSQPRRTRPTRTSASAGLGVAVLAATTALAPGTAQAAEVAPARSAGSLAFATGSGAPRAWSPAPASTPEVTHAVQPGETVSHLALRYGTSIEAIVAANGLDSRALVRIGQALRIPAPGAAPAPQAAPAAPAPTAGQRHVVAAGETVSDLALRYGTSIGAIVAANGLDSRALIRIGQTLTIPGPGAPAAAAPAPAPALVGNTFAGRTYSADVVAGANANKATLLSRSVPSREEMQQLVRSTAIAMGVDPSLAQAVAYQESGFDQRAVSPANAVGTMQVIPSSGVWASDLVGRPLDLLDPRDNVTAGVAILRQLLRSTDDLPTAIASYYQGLGSVRRNGMYSDTRRYVANVQTLMTRFA